jgi:hypothetical protein
MTTIKNIVRGSFFKRKETSNRVYVKGHYCRTLKKWSCIAHDDHCQELFLKSDTPIFTDFIY